MISRTRDVRNEGKWRNHATHEEPSSKKSKEVDFEEWKVEICSNLKF